MKRGDVFIGGGEAWRVTNDPAKDDKVKLIQIAGSETTAVRTEDVPKTLLTGKTLYRAVTDLADLDVTLAAAEITRYIDVSALSWNPHLWVTAFLKKYEGETVPDHTTLIGWFANLMDAGAERKLEELRKAKSAKQKKRRQLKKVPVLALPKRGRKGAKKW